MLKTYKHEDDYTPKEGDLRVSWIPQIPGKPFLVHVDSVQEGVDLCNILASYDLFQYENNIKPDYANMGGVSRWEDWSDEFGWGDIDEEEYL